MTAPTETTRPQVRPLTLALQQMLRDGLVVLTTQDGQVGYQITDKGRAKLEGNQS